MISLKENINNFLFYIEKIRGYSSNSIVTYENILLEMLAVSHYYQEDKKIILDMTPLRLKIVDNSKKTISKKLSVVRSFIKFMKEQKEVTVQLIGDSPPLIRYVTPLQHICCIMEQESQMYLS